jgi:hypothetical protein
MSATGNAATTSHITTPWVKSSYSGPQGNCVEVARLAGGEIAVRNSRHLDGPVLIFTRAEWDAFISCARRGEFGELT